MTSRVRMRLAAAAVGFSLLVAAPPTRADDAPVSEQIVGMMIKLFGDHPGVRVNHTKGIVVEGTFTAAGEGARLTAAAPFQPGVSTPLTARFSDATGVPTIPDGDPNANPHGLALRFNLADGSVFDIVANSLTIFPVATADEFLALLQAVAASGPGVASPTPIETFVAAHPSVAQANAALATPSGFGRERYNGINAFVFVDAAGERRPFRFRIEPVAGIAHLSPDEAASQPPEFLAEELRSTMSQQPVRFRLLAQLAGPGDPTDDPSKAWPDDRELVDLGEIALTAPVADNAAAERPLVFFPGNLPEGIEPSDDAMIDVRNEAYAVSFGRRAE